MRARDSMRGCVRAQDLGFGLDTRVKAQDLGFGLDTRVKAQRLGWITFGEP